jgi:hypothetical protein
VAEKASLDGIQTRLGWARQYVNDLKKISADFMRPDPNPGSAIDYEQKPGHVLVSVYLPGDFPDEFGRIMGGAFHQLRSLFDNLAYQLVLANHGTPTKKTEFPILKDGTDFDKRTKNALAGMSTTARAEIKALQPFNEWPQHPEHTTLWLIHELNNIDKHRLAHLACLWIATCNATLNTMGGIPAADIDARFEYVAERGVAEHKAPLLDIRWDAAKVAALTGHQVAVDIDISSDVALKNPERTGFLDPDGKPTDALPVAHFLDAALKYCETTVLPRFAQEFK